VSRLLARADLEALGFVVPAATYDAYAAAARRAETATFDSSWADGRPICHVCRLVVGVGEAIILPTGRHVEDDEALIGVIAHRRCVGMEGDG